jgi:hypothetical protein
MGLGDVAGIFSRYFIVGFFLPAFFALVTLSQTLTDEFLPQVYETASDGARIAIIGGGALLTGLVLLGLNYPVIRLYEGYPLAYRKERWYAKHLYAYLIGRQRRRFEAAREEAGSLTVQQRNALWRLDRTFPRDGKHLLLPTAFGNAIQAYERHAKIRWGLNSISAWPRVELLFSGEEAQLHADAKSELGFFINSSLLAVVAGLVLVVDAIANEPLAWYAAPLYAIPFLVSMAFYRASIGAAVRRGEAVRASIDIHRLELYEKMGLRAPSNFTDERTVVAPALNAALLRGDHIPDALWATPEPAASEPQQPASADGAATINLGALSLRVERAKKETSKR